METIVRILHPSFRVPNRGGACAGPMSRSARQKPRSRPGRPPNAVPRWVIMIEGDKPEAVQAALAGALGSAAFNSFALTDPARGTYVLQFDLLTSSG